MPLRSLVLVPLNHSWDLSPLAGSNNISIVRGDRLQSIEIFKSYTTLLMTRMKQSKCAGYIFFFMFIAKSLMAPCITAGEYDVHDLLLIDSMSIASDHVHGLGTVHLRLTSPYSLCIRSLG